MSINVACVCRFSSNLHRAEPAFNRKESRRGVSRAHYHRDAPQFAGGSLRHIAPVADLVHYRRFWPSLAARRAYPSLWSRTVCSPSRAETREYGGSRPNMHACAQSLRANILALDCTRDPPRGKIGALANIGWCLSEVRPSSSRFGIRWPTHFLANTPPKRARLYSQSVKWHAVTNDARCERVELSYIGGTRDEGVCGKRLNLHRLVRLWNASCWKRERIAAILTYFTTTARGPDEVHP